MTIGSKPEELQRERTKKTRDLANIPTEDSSRNCVVAKQEDEEEDLFIRGRSQSVCVEVTREYSLCPSELRKCLKKIRA